MENQGRSPEKIKFSEDMVFYGILGMLLIVLFSLILKILNNL
jgi:hypothetical protein